MPVTKIYSRKVQKNIGFATTDELVEQLHVFEKQMGWSIFEILKVLKDRKADSLSVTKEKPFHYLYARLSEKTIIIRLQTSEMETEFRLPIEKIKE
ncbi:MAG: hypothetical protein ACUVRA_06910 [Candidatus Bathyarchaeaceae archaeon]